MLSENTFAACVLIVAYTFNRVAGVSPAAARVWLFVVELSVEFTQHFVTRTGLRTGPPSRKRVLRGRASDYFRD